MELPECRQRGRELRPGFVECFSDRLVHFGPGGLAPVATCLHPCPYVNRPNRRSGLGDWVARCLRLLRVPRPQNCGCGARQRELNRWGWRWGERLLGLLHRVLRWRVR